MVALAIRQVLVEQMLIPRTEYEIVMRLIESPMGVTLSRCLPPVDVVNPDRIGDCVRPEFPGHSPILAFRYGSTGADERPRCSISVFRA